jgi:hypothetical protein
MRAGVAQSVKCLTGLLMPSQECIGLSSIVYCDENCYRPVALNRCAASFNEVRREALNRRVII